MRIAFITPEFPTEPGVSGGLSNYLARVSRALTDCGHEVHVFTKSADQESPTVDYHGVHVHRVIPLWDKRMLFDHLDPLVPRSLYNFYQDIKSAWCLRRAFKRVGKQLSFDIIQVANVSACGYFFRKERHTPVVTRLSSFRPLTDTFSGVKVDFGLRMRWRFEQAATEGTPFHYAPSAFVAEQTVKHYDVSHVDVVETPFFAEVAQTDDSVYRKHLAGKDYLLHFGRQSPLKGTHLLAEALPNVLEQHPDLHAVFVGEDTTQAPDGGSMRAFISSKNEAFLDRVHFFNSLSHVQLYPIVQRSQAVLIPSLTDNLPNTCLESMGLGKVVVAATGSCFEQLITDGDTGFLTDPTAADLTDTILRTLSLYRHERDAMGKRAQTSLQRLHPNQAMPRLIDYYSSLVSRFHRDPHHSRRQIAAPQPRIA